MNKKNILAIGLSKAAKFKKSLLVHVFAFSVDFFLLFRYRDGREPHLLATGFTIDSYSRTYVLSGYPPTREISLRIPENHFFVRIVV